MVTAGRGRRPAIGGYTGAGTVRHVPYRGHSGVSRTGAERGEGTVPETVAPGSLSWAELRRRYTVLDDSAVLVVNKPAGISVMGERHETDLVRTARDGGEELWPVHRIDKVTSGAVLLARNLDVHSGLTRQFTRRTVDKVYLAVTRSSGLPERGTVDLPLVTAGSGRVRVAAERGRIAADGTDEAGRWSVAADDVFAHTRTYPSLTTFAKVAEGSGHTLLAVRPVSGRRHQIRVHLAWIGHPIDGDPLFDRAAAGRGVRTLLHSWQLAFDAAWSGGARLRVAADPGDDFWAPVLAAHVVGTPAVLLDRAARAVEALGG